MTQNATAYFQVEESKRSNRAQEAELNRHNIQAENTERNRILEMERHNREAEAIEWARNQEQARHNQQAEWLSMLGYEIQRRLGYENVKLGYANVGQAYASLAEAITHNRNTEAELRRSHLAAEKENIRHNVRTEGTAAYNARTQRLDTTWSNINKGVSNLASLSQASTAGRRLDSEIEWRQQDRTQNYVLGFTHEANSLLQTGIQSWTSRVNATTQAASNIIGSLLRLAK